MRAGIIGLGGISPSHIAALLNLEQEIVAFCDVDIEKCREKNEKFGINAKIYSDYKQMLNEAELDVVHICTPHYLHAEMTCEALSKNINVICEKPIAITLEQLADVEKAVKSSQAQLGVCFQNRFNKSNIYVKEFLKDKVVDAAYASIIWQRDASYYSLAEWRGTWAQEGGGVMINQAIHSVDFLLNVCGMPESVIANVANNSLKNEIEVEDTAFGLFKLKNGNKFIINATNSASGTFPVVFNFFAGKDRLQLCENDITLNGNVISLSDELTPVGKAVWGTGHQRLIENFYNCVKTGEKFSVGYDEACKAVKLVLAMYRSNGEEIKID